MSTSTEQRTGWVVVVAGKVKGGEHPTRNAGREYAKAKGLEGFKVVKAEDAPTSTRARTTSTRHTRKTSTKAKATGGYVPAVRRKCADCGHYRKRDEQILVEREVTFERNGKAITQTRYVAVCAGGCRENTR